MCHLIYFRHTQSIYLYKGCGAVSIDRVPMGLIHLKTQTVKTAPAFYTLPLETAPDPYGIRFFTKT